MGDSDDEYDRKRRDKFRGERTGGESNYRREERSGRDDWERVDRSRSKPDYRDFRGVGSARDRMYSPGREFPPMKRMRPDWDEGARHRYDPYAGGYGGGWGGHDHYPMHHGPAYSAPMPAREAPVNPDLQTQPCMMTLKQFLTTQDDAISDADAIQKYNEYKLDFKRQQLNEFFVTHKDEEWFKLKYHPEEYHKRREEQTEFLKKRVEVFSELLNNEAITSVSVDVGQNDQLLRLLDTVVIKLEGGTEDDLKVLDEKPVEVKPAEVAKNEKPGEKKSTSNDDLPEGEEKKAGEDGDGASEADKAMVIDDDDEEVKKEKEEAPVKVESNGGGGAKKRKRSSSSSSSSSSSDSEDEEKAAEKPPKSPEPEIEEEAKNDAASKGSNDANEEEEEEKKMEVENEKEDEDKKENEDEEKEEGEEGETENKSSETKEEITEIVDLDKEKEVEEGPRALHRTSSIFLRNLAPTITKAEVEAMCKKYDGFLRVAIADPLVERRWFRRGWITFKRDVNIKEICWNLNNIRLRDCEMGAIVNRDLSRRVRPVNGITVHKTVVRNDIKICAKIAHNMDEKAGLWKEAISEGDGSYKTESFGLNSKNPVLQNITDYLIEEASAEEEELLGLNSSGGEGKDNGEGNGGETIEKDPALTSVLDKLILYLRIVHSVDFYNHCEYPYEDEMPNRCGIIHARAVPQNKVTSQEIQDYNRNFETKMQSFLQRNVPIEEEELKKIGCKDSEQEVEKFITANTQELAKDKWLCPLSGKKFKGPEFIRKHILNKHSEKVEEVKKEVEYFNNYLKDPKRPQLPEHPGNSKRAAPEQSHQQPMGFGRYRHPYAAPGVYGAAPYGSYGPPMMGGPRPRGGGPGFGQRRGPPADYRPIIHYRDLDAPREPEEFL